MGLREDLVDSDQLTGKLSRMLTKIAAATYGPPPDGVWHDWSRLADDIGAIRIRLDDNLDIIRELAGRFICDMHGRGCIPHALAELERLAIEHGDPDAAGSVAQ